MVGMLMYLTDAVIAFMSLTSAAVEYESFLDIQTQNYLSVLVSATSPHSPLLLLLKSLLPPSFCCSFFYSIYVFFSPYPSHFCIPLNFHFCSWYIKMISSCGTIPFHLLQFLGLPAPTTHLKNSLLACSFLLLSRTEVERRGGVTPTVSSRMVFGHLSPT